MSALFGSRPSVPNLPTVSLAQQQGAAIGANQAALPGAEALASETNQFNQQQVNEMLGQLFPGMSGVANTISQNIASEASGKLPDDVQAAVERSGAAKSLGMGVAGSGTGADMTARDLGLTSLQLTGQGLSSAESWINEADKVYSPGEMNVQSMFVSPEQMYQATNQQDTQQFQRSMMQNEINAAPDPVVSGVVNMVPNAVGAMRGGSQLGSGGGGDSSGGGMPDEYGGLWDQ